MKNSASSAKTAHKNLKLEEFNEMWGLDTQQPTFTEEREPIFAEDQCEPIELLFGPVADLFEQQKFEWDSLHDIHNDGNNKVKKRKQNQGQTLTIKIAKKILAGNLSKKLNINLTQSIDDNEITVQQLQTDFDLILAKKIKKEEQKDIQELNTNIIKQRTIIKSQLTNFSQNQIKKSLTKVFSSNQVLTVASIAEFSPEEINKLKPQLIQQYLSERSRNDPSSNQQILIFDFNDALLQRWDTLVIIFTIWNSIFIPFKIAFEPPVTFAIEIIQSFMYIIYIIDILIQFRTSYLTFEGELITDWQKIAFRYIFQGPFLLDITAAIPYNIITPGIDLELMELFLLAKLSRLSRLEALIASFKEETKAVFKVGRVTMQLLIYLHLVCCIWFYGCKQFGDWIPPMEVGSLKTEIYTSPDLWLQYFTCFHVSVMCFTGNEMHPRTSFELAFASFFIILAYIINGQIFGEMAVLISVINRKDNEYTNKIDNINRAMLNIMLPQELSNEIRSYVVLTQNKRDLQAELNKFLEMISPQFKLKVSWHIFFNIFTINPVLKYSLQGSHMKIQNKGDGQGSDIVSLFVRRLMLKLDNPENYVVMQHDLTYDIFFIAQGEVIVSMVDTQRETYDQIRVLKTGDHFGEISVLFKCRRTATVRCLDYCTFAVLPFNNYERLVGENPEFETELKNHVFTKYNQDPVKQWAFQILKQLPFLQELEPENEWKLLHNIYYTMKRNTIDQGELLFKMGQENPYLRIVQDGVLDIFTIFEEEEFHLETLMRGSVLNHRTFFMEDAQQVFMRATEHTTVLEITLPQLQGFISMSPIYERKLLSHQMKILNSQKNYPLDYIRRVHPDFMAQSESNMLPETIERASLMKLMVMRRVQEIRQEKAKPKLAELLKGLKGGLQQRVETRKRILDLYELDENERQNQIKSQKEELRKYMDPGDEIEQNKLFIKMKIMLKKAMEELEQQEDMIFNIQDGLAEQLGDIVDADYDDLSDILFKNKQDLFNFEERKPKLSNNGKTETFNIVKDALHQNLQKHAMYLADQYIDISNNQNEIESLQTQIGLAARLKAKRGEKSDVRQLSFQMKSQRSRIKKAIIFEVPPKISIIDTSTINEEKTSLLKKIPARSEQDQKLKREKNEKIRRYLTLRAPDESGRIGENDFIISFNNPNRIYWDALILIMAMWNCIETPISLAFHPQEMMGVHIINYVIDLFFYFDIMVAFRTSVLTYDGQEVKDSKKIAIQYIFQGTFILDLLSVFPFDDVIPGENKTFELLRLLKLIRIKRLPMLIKRLDLKAENKAYFEIGKVAFFLVLYLHLICCGWFACCNILGIWLPTMDASTMKTEIYTKGDLTLQYFTAFHVAVMTFTGNEMLPRSNILLAVASFIILLSYVVNGNLFGQMAVLIRTINKRAKLHSINLERTQAIMSKISLPQELQNEMKKYQLHALGKIDYQNDLNHFLSMISLGLKQKVYFHLLNQVFELNSVLQAIIQIQPLKKRTVNKDGSDIISLFMRRLTLQQSNPDLTVIQQGDQTTEIYCIVHGEALVSMTNTAKDPYHNFRTLSEGDHFGEIACIYNCPRTATVVTQDYTMFAVLTQDNYLKIAGEVPEVHNEMKRFVHDKYNNDMVKLWAFETLIQLPFLQGLEMDKEWALFHQIYFSMTRRTINEGEFITMPGQEIKNLIIVQDGVIDIFTKFKDINFIFEKLMRGSIMNYRSFFMNETAQIYAQVVTQEAIVLEITFDKLRTLIKSSDLFERKLISHELKILNSRKIYPLDYIRRWHSDFMTLSQHNAQSEVEQRSTQMKLIVMRKLIEIRQSKAKPSLRQLLLGGIKRLSAKQKLLKRKQFLDNFEHEDETQREAARQLSINNIIETYQEEGEDVRKDKANQAFIQMKIRLRKSMDELDQQAEIIKLIKDKLNEKLGKDNVYQQLPPQFKKEEVKD